MELLSSQKTSSIHRTTTVATCMPWNSALSSSRVSPGSSGASPSAAARQQHAFNSTKLARRWSRSAFVREAIPRLRSNLPNNVL